MYTRSTVVFDHMRHNTDSHAASPKGHCKHSAIHSVSYFLMCFAVSGLSIEHEAPATTPAGATVHARGIEWLPAVCLISTART